MSIANELITRGHTTNGQYEDDGTGAVCLRGAAGYAFSCKPWRLPEHVEDALYVVINGPREYWREGLIGLVEFSDRASADDVLRVAKEADEILGVS